MSEGTRWIDCEGTFTAKVLKPSGGWFHESTTNKTPYIAVYLEVVGDSVDAGKIAKWTGYLSEKALPNTMRTLHFCFGFNGELADLNEGKITFEGMEVSMVVEPETYNEKTRYKVKWLNPVGYQPAAVGMTPESVKVLVGALSSKAKVACLEAAKEAEEEGFKVPRNGHTKPAASRGRKPAPASAEDDVPF